jgi:DNA-binding MarR family transcriptional regulator
MERDDEAAAGELAVAMIITAGRLARSTQLPGGAGLSASEIAILTDIAGQPGIFPVQVRTMERIQASTMSVHLKDLTGRGLVLSQPDTADKRKIQLFITAYGQQALTAARETAWLTAALAELPAGSRERLRQALAIMDTLRPVAPPAPPELSPGSGDPTEELLPATRSARRVPATTDPC